MVLDDNEKVFLVIVGDSFVQFRYKPFKQMEDILNDYNIPFIEGDKRFRRKDLLESNVQKMTKYVFPSSDGKRFNVFFFTTDAIDMIFNHYGVPFEKEVKING